MAVLCFHIIITNLWVIGINENKPFPFVIKHKATMVNMRFKYRLYITSKITHVFFLETLTGFYSSNQKQV